MTDQERDVLQGVRDALDKAIEEIPPESTWLTTLIRLDDGIRVVTGGPTRPSVRSHGEKLKARRRRQRSERPRHLHPVEAS
jgi:hypothetical protein